MVYTMDKYLYLLPMETRIVRSNKMFQYFNRTSDFPDSLLHHIIPPLGHYVPARTCVATWRARRSRPRPC